MKILFFAVIVIRSNAGRSRAFYRQSIMLKVHGVIRMKAEMSQHQLKVSRIGLFRIVLQGEHLIRHGVKTECFELLVICSSQNDLTIQILLKKIVHVLEHARALNNKCINCINKDCFHRDIRSLKNGYAYRKIAGVIANTTNIQTAPTRLYISVIKTQKQSSRPIGHLTK